MKYLTSLTAQKYDILQARGAVTLLLIQWIPQCLGWIALEPAHEKHWYRQHHVTNCHKMEQIYAEHVWNRQLIYSSYDIVLRTYVFAHVKQ